MRRLIKNITDPILKKELEAIWEFLSRIETKTVAPTALTTTPGEIVMYNGKLYINDQNVIRNLTPTGADGAYLKADGSVTLTGNMSVDTGKTIDGVDIGAHKAGTAKAQHSAIGDHTHAAAGAEGGSIFDATNPAALGTADPGTSTIASHRDHVHTLPKLDDLAAPDNNTDLDVSIAAHGLCPKAPNDITKFLRGDGAWAAIAITWMLLTAVSQQIVSLQGISSNQPITAVSVQTVSLQSVAPSSPSIGVTVA